MYKKFIRRLISIVFSIFALVMAYVFIFFMPIRIAVKPENIDNSKFYVITEPISATEYKWLIIAEKDNKEAVYIDTKIKGNLPDVSYEYYFMQEDNKFVLYGHYEEKNSEDNQWNAVFYVDEFDIIYPVKHGLNGMGILDNLYSWYISYLDIASDFDSEEFIKFLK